MDPTFVATITFTLGARDYDTAIDLAEQIGALVQHEDLASSWSIIDLEQTDDDKDDPDYNEDEDDDE